MRRNEEPLKYLPYILGIIIIAGAVLVATGNVKLDFLKTGETYSPGGEGFTVQGVSATNTLSNDADLNSANFIITAAATGAGQSLVGRFDDDIVQKFSNLIIKYPLQITAGAVKETLTYPIRNDGDSGSIYKYELVTENRKDYWTGAACNIGRQGYITCQIVSEVQGVEDAPLIGGNDRVIKIFKNKIGNTGSIDNPNIDFSLPITVTANGISYTQTIQSRGTPENAGTSTAEFRTAAGTWLGTVQWTGSMVTGQATPQPSLYKATYTPGANRWNIASSSTYQTYKQTTDAALMIDGFIQKFKTDGALCGTLADNIMPITLEAIQKCNNAINAAQSSVNGQVRTADTLINQNIEISYSASTTDTFTTTGTPMNSDGSGTITQTSTRKVTIPSLTFTIKANAIAVFAPVGVPEIVSITVPKFASGDANGVATVRVKNAGTATGTFQATFSESTGTFYQSGNTLGSRITLDAGQTGDILVYIGHGTTATEISQTATFRVSDVNSGKYVEKTAVIGMTPPKACTPNTTKQDGQQVSQCKPDGTGYTLILDCSAKGMVVDYTGGTPTCKVGVGATSTPTTPGGSTVDDSINAEKVNWYDTTPAKILAGLIVVLVILLVWRKQNE